MSRGFVKEEDQEEAPFIPPRPSLPPGVTNYVTPDGLKNLQKEREDLETQRRDLKNLSEKEKRHASAIIDGKINLLLDRITSARVIDPKEQPKNEVRFGATVTFEFLSGGRKGQKQTFTIVGVDEADIKLQKLSFLAPLARVLTGKKVGEKAQLQMGGKLQELEVIAISYSS